ncbi:hypothetical protein EST38_g9018 [Candolleomyces aberdarensis]|uniref:Oxidized purine nucleoside triphosphate hydrolase n=1 Tax=Candolleomyces aberdarensis TaxID=2316362 RepID=A0A4Q2DCS9_9AGAR|nr:hypothetical protein EST38_g9018 [Candolleomyces aberdarensis]
MDQLPPGITGNVKRFLSGSQKDALQWRQIKTLKHYTNAFVVQDGKVRSLVVPFLSTAHIKEVQILLGMKKRGWGIGKYNGFGGKVDQGETPLEAAMRELEEEAGIQAPLEYAGTLIFLTDDVEWAFHIHIYRADSYTGTITESEEMKPEWFSASPDTTDLPPIPFERMWETDEAWIPLLISKKTFIGRADFVGPKDQSKPYKWWYGTVEDS